MSEEIRKKLCGTFCRYYKSAEKEDLACLGFLVIEKLHGQGLNIPFDKADGVPAAKTQEILFRYLCTSCPFYEDGCDFADTCRLEEHGAPNPVSPPLHRIAGGSKSAKKALPLPCGGFIVLVNLLQKRIINIDDIRNII
ncbi:MAG: hypothetical protein AB1552_01340 [Nitrospirota bacterium]